MLKLEHLRDLSSNLLGIKYTMHNTKREHDVYTFPFPKRSAKIPRKLKLC